MSEPRAINVAPDVAIIGLGPAGACAAQIIAAAGFTVVAFDRKRQAGAPVQCAEFVPLMLGTNMDATINSMIQPITTMETFVEAQSADIAGNFSGRMIDREAFDRDLVEKAVHAGADCRFGVAINQIDDAGTIMIDDQPMTAKIIIGADGPRSRVGAAIGQTNETVLETRQITVPLLNSHTATDIFLSDEYPGGYGWLFPKGDEANIGIGVNWDQRHHLKHLVESLHQRLIKEGRCGENILRHTGGAIPAGGMLSLTAYLNDTLVLLAGDAAGLTNCITGAGIAAAVMSGRLAGAAAVSWLDGDKEAPAEYAEDLADLFGPSLVRACAHRQKLTDARHNNTPLTPAALRNSWIAYPQYWT